MGVCNSEPKKNKNKETQSKAPQQHQKASELSNPEEKAILQCKITRDNIKSYIKKLEKNSLQRKEKAKLELKTKNREKAKFFLNQSKFYTEQVKVASGQLTMIEEQITRIESAQMQRDAIRVLEEGNRVLKKLNEEVNVERWEKIADDMADMKSQQDEIGNFLRNHGIDEVEYDDQLNKELENLMKIEGVIIEESEFPDAGKKEPEKKSEEKEIKNEERVAIEA
jgi:charged multivesicular body protein 6